MHHFVILILSGSCRDLEIASARVVPAPDSIVIAHMQRYLRRAKIVFTPQCFSINTPVICDTMCALPFPLPRNLVVAQREISACHRGQEEENVKEQGEEGGRVRSAVCHGAIYFSHFVGTREEVPDQ